MLSRRCPCCPTVPPCLATSLRRVILPLDSPPETCGLGDPTLCPSEDSAYSRWPASDFSQHQRQGAGGGRWWQVRPGLHQGPSPELVGIVCLKQTGLVQEDVCLHGAAAPFITVALALGARMSAFQGPGPQGAAPGAAPPGTARRRCQES